MTYPISQMVLEGGVAALFCIIAVFGAVAFSRHVIGRYGVGWIVRLFIPVATAGVALFAMWGAQFVFFVLDPPEAIRPPAPTGEFFTELTLNMAFVLAQAGAGFEHIYGVAAAGAASAAVWFGITCTAALRAWRKNKAVGR